MVRPSLWMSRQATPSTLARWRLRTRKAFHLASSLGIISCAAECKSPSELRLCVPGSMQICVKTLDDQDHHVGCRGMQHHRQRDHLVNDVEKENEVMKLQKDNAKGDYERLMADAGDNRAADSTSMSVPGMQIF